MNTLIVKKVPLTLDEIQSVKKYLESQLLDPPPTEIDSRVEESTNCARALLLYIRIQEGSNPSVHVEEDYM